MYLNKNFLSETINLFKENKIEIENYINKICDIIEKQDSAIMALMPEKNRRERLLKDAELLKKKFPIPENRPIFFGIPIGVKDIFNVDGFETTGGSNLPTHLFEGKEASSVTKLKKAGALILGKTVTTEFAYFEPGPTRNPHNLKHTPGGSSSGSAAAVACGYTPFSFGTQTIGSVIRPAAYCGIFGFKPSFGRIFTDGVIPFSVSTDHIGFFTQDFEGIKISANVLCLNWNNDIKIVSNKPIIGIVDEPYLFLADTEIRDLFEEKILELQKNNYNVIRLNLFADIDHIISLQRLINAKEFYEVHKNWYEKYENLYRPASKELILKGKQISNQQKEDAVKEQIKIRERVEKIMTLNKIDILMSPSTTTIAPEGTATGSPLMNLPWSFTGQPVVTIPAGKSKNNLPFGLQFAGFFGQDEKLLEIVKFLNEIYM